MFWGFEPPDKVGEESTETMESGGNFKKAQWEMLYESG